MFRYFNDLGGIVNSEGKRIKSGLLIRGTPLYCLKDKDKEYIDSLNLRTIIDFRHPDEIKLAEDYIPKNCCYIPISIIDNAISSITHVKAPKDQLMELRKMPSIQEVYRDMFSNDYPLSKIREAIRDIVFDDSLPVYYHCVTGKDRTGLTTVILLHILGCNKNTIDETYLYTYPIYIRHAWVMFFKTLIFSLSYKDAIKAKNMYTVKSEYVDIIYKTVNEKFGSMDRFIADYIGIGNKEISDFKARILE